MTVLARLLHKAEFAAKNQPLFGVAGGMVFPQSSVFERGPNRGPGNPVGAVFEEP